MAGLVERVGLLAPNGRITTAAYLLGARAGKERYETVRAWAERISRKAQGLVGSSEDGMPGIERTSPTP